MAHAETFPAPLHATVPGGHGDVVVGPDFEHAAPAFASTAKDLRAGGAQLLTANCGFAVAYQDEVARVAAPAALSSLLLLPLLVRVFAGGVGVLTYDAAELDDDRRAMVPWPQDVDVPVAGVFTDDVRWATGVATFDLTVFVNYLAAQLPPRHKEAADG